jgi:hypothetical protein
VDTGEAGDGVEVMRRAGEVVTEVLVPVLRLRR